MMDDGTPKPHSVNLRKGRFSESGRVYLVTTVTHERQRIFENVVLGRLLVDEFRTTDNNGRASSLAWVVMPDHFHWLLELRQDSLSELIRNVKGRSATKINQRLGRAGRLWQAGFHDHAVRKDEDLQALARYVLANPLRAGLVKSLRDYPLWDAIWL